MAPTNQQLNRAFNLPPNYRGDRLFSDKNGNRSLKPAGDFLHRVSIHAKGRHSTVAELAVITEKLVKMGVVSRQSHIEVNGAVFQKFKGTDPKIIAIEAAHRAPGQLRIQHLIPLQLRGPNGKALSKAFQVRVYNLFDEVDWLDRVVNVIDHRLDWTPTTEFSGGGKVTSQRLGTASQNNSAGRGVDRFLELIEDVAHGVSAQDAFGQYQIDQRRTLGTICARARDERISEGEELLMIGASLREPDLRTGISKAEIEQRMNDKAYKRELQAQSLAVMDLYLEDLKRGVHDLASGDMERKIQSEEWLVP